MAKTVVLDIKNLTKTYGAGNKAFTAVDGISFSVKEGEIVGLLGPNGAGKTTTLSMVLGILTPTSGKIEIFGKDFTKNREEILQKMNYSSAYVRAPWRIKVWEHLYVFALLYKIANPREKVSKMLEVFSLEKHRNTFAGDLSAGNMARLNLSKAFVNDPKLVLLDEPTSSLDPDIADRVRKFIKKSQEEFNTTVLITSHNMSEIEELCDRVIFINKGKIIATDTPESLAKKIKRARVRLMISDGIKRTLAYCKEKKLAVQTSGRYVTIGIAEKEVADLLRGLAEVGVEYSEISIDKPTLKDFFISSTREYEETNSFIEEGRDES